MDKSIEVHSDEPQVAFGFLLQEYKACVSICLSLSMNAMPVLGSIQRPLSFLCLSNKLFQLAESFMA